MYDTAFTTSLRRQSPSCEWSFSRTAVVLVILFFIICSIGPSLDISDTSGAVREGDEGAHVAQIQRLLYGVGVYRGPINGYFSSQVEVAVKTFQQLCNLQIDGVVGPVTWRHLEQQNMQLTTAD